MSDIPKIGFVNHDCDRCKAADELRRLDAENDAMRQRVAELEQRVPDGWKLVPVNPDGNMKIAGGFACTRGQDIAHHTYTAMLAAAPQPASAQPVAKTEPYYTSLSVPMGRIAERKLDSLIVDGYSVCGVMIERSNEDATQVKRGAVSVGGLVLWWSPEQPVAYPVAQPERVVQGEPVAWPTMPPRKQADQYCLDVLVSKLANVRSIAARRLPSVDVATIDDAITVLRTRQQPEPAVQGEPVYQCQSADGRWTDQTRESYEYNARHASDKIRVLYTRPSVPLTREAIQQAFEAWIKTDSTLPVTKQRHGYTNFTVALQWHAWQAAHKTGCE